MTKQLEAKLSSLGVSMLVEHLGESKIQKINELGVEITAANLAKYIANESGIDVFRDSIFRLQILATLAREELSKLLSVATPTSEALLAWNDFRWGVNKNMKAFVSVY